MNVTEEIFFSSAARARLEINQLADFASLWRLDEEWFEKPNTRGQGFSGVVTRVLKSETGQSKRVFIKKQEDHTTRSLAHPIKGIPTFKREYTNIVSLSALGVPTIELLYFGTAEHKGRQRAILVSYALDEFTPVDEWFRQARSQVSDATAHAVLRALVAAIKSIHQAGYRHGCLYGKHIFIRVAEGDVLDDHLGDHLDDQIEVRMLDFEKAHRSAFIRRAILKDLSQFVRHCEKLTAADLEYFLARYFDQPNPLRTRRLLMNEIGKKRSKS